MVCPGLAAVAALPVTLALVGYLLGIDKFTGILRSTNILLHTAAALFVLSLGVPRRDPERPPVRAFLHRRDGVLLRWTLPGTAALLLALGWLIGRGRAAGLVVAGKARR